MRKIFAETDVPATKEYSESYVVRFSFQTTDGVWIRDSVRYFTASKNAHRHVELYWKKRHPKAQLISVKYE